MDCNDNSIRVIQHIVKLQVYPALIDSDLKEKGLNCKKATVAKISAYIESVTEHQMAMGLILGSDQLSFGKLIEDLENQHT